MIGFGVAGLLPAGLDASTLTRDWSRGDAGRPGHRRADLRSRVHPHLHRPGGHLRRGHRRAVLLPHGRLSDEPVPAPQTTSKPFRPDLFEGAHVRSTIAIVGSGPIGSTYARVLLEQIPDARVVMFEAGPQLTDLPGESVRNIADPVKGPRAGNVAGTAGRRLP